MNTFKVIVGLLLIYGAGTEYVRASRELSSLLAPLVPMLVVLLLCAWLISSGYTKERVRLNTARFWKYFGFSCIAFVFVAFISAAVN